MASVLTETSEAAAVAGKSGRLLSSVTAKTIMGISGLGLVGFVIAHMLGNLQIYLGQDVLNAYAYKLKSMPVVLWIFRGGLIGMFTAHLGLASYLRMLNKSARPQGYVAQDPVEASLASRTMLLSGLVIFAFLIYHLLHFTLGVTNPSSFSLVDSEGHHDVYSMVVLSFQNVFVSGAYIVAMVFLGLHLSHAIPSMLQTLGLVSGNSRVWVKRAGMTLAGILMLGNISIPVAILLGAIGLPEGVSP